MLTFVHVDVDDLGPVLYLVTRHLQRLLALLLLDEATSALDTNTEKLIMDEISLLRKDLTIIMIAHRHSTLLKCDRIIEIKKGKIITNHDPA